MQWIHQRQTRRSLRRAIIATAALACALTATTAANAAGSCTPNAGNTHMVCLYTAAGTDSFTVPAGVRRVWITAVGGGGGGAGMADSLGQPGWTSLGGNGATVTVGGAPVLPGGTLSIYVGAGGVNGTRTSGGGGGGATKVSGYNSMTSLLGTLLQTDIAIIAGGGGGAGGVAFGGGQGGHGGAFANGKGGDGAIAGYLGRCAGGGGGGATAAGGTGILDNGDTINSCLAGATVTNNNASGGNGGSSQDGGTGGLGADAMLGAGGSGGRACSFLCPNADNWAGGGGGGGGWGGGGGGYFGAGGGAGGSKVASTISLDGVTTAYSTDAGNGGVGSTNTPSESGWVRIAYPLLSQAITIDPPSALWRVGTPFTIPVSSTGSDNPVTFARANRFSPACSVSDNVITFIHGYNECQVLASKEGTLDYLHAETFYPTGGSRLVHPGLQTIVYTSSAAGAKVDDTYTPVATGGGSGKPVTFALHLRTDDSYPCSIDGSGRVTFTHVGTCTIRASQAGTDAPYENDYWAASNVNQVITVDKADQAIAFTSTAPAPVYGDASTYTPIASGGNSGNARTFTIDASASGVCSISAGIVTFQHAGTCTINANQAGTDDYNPAPQTQQTLTVSKADQAVAFTTSAPGPVYGDSSTYAPAASDGGSGNARVFTIDASASSVCSISAGIVTFQHAGTCTINANQTGSSDYNPAPQTQQSITVDKANQATSFTSSLADPRVDGTYTPIASGGGSGNARTFTIDASASGVCTISAGIVTFQHVGTCTINANQTGTSDYYAAPQSQQTLTVDKADQTIAFTSTAPTPVYGDASQYTPAASGGNSGNARTFTIDASSSSVCTISAGIVTFQHAGTCLVNANQTGSSDYNAAPQTQQSITVDKANQATSFTSSLADPRVDGTYTPIASGGGSGNARTFTIDASASGVCTISAGIVTFQHVGTCTINANQTGTSDYYAAPQSQQTLTVDKADQTIAFTSTAPTPVYGDASQYTPAASGGNSGNARTFTIDASSSSVCTISAGIVTFQHAGTCTINANQTGTTDYNPAPQTQQSITVNRAPQAISFTSTVPDPTFGDIAGYTPTATGGASGNSVVIAVSSDAGDTCAIDGTGHVSFQHGGICTITATQAGTANYLAAPPVTQAVRILPAAQTVAIASAAPTGTIAGGDAYTPTTTGSDRGTAIVVAATGACVLRDGRIAPVSPGTCRVTATRPASRDFAAAEATQTYDVGAPPVTTSTTVAAVPNAAGSATVAGVQVAWPAKAFAGPVTVGVTTSPAAASFAAGTTPIRLQVTDAAGKPVTSFREPLEIVFAPGSGTPGYSRDGRTWTAIPRITGPRLPNGYADGWFAAADGSIHVLTTHATDFGILAKGAKIAPALRLTAVSTKRQGAKLMVRVATSLPARIQVRLQGASATAVRTSSTSLTLRIPAQCATKACTLVVRATAGGETAARTVRVR